MSVARNLVRVRNVIDNGDLLVISSTDVEWNGKTELIQVVTLVDPNGPISSAYSGLYGDPTSDKSRTGAAYDYAVRLNKQRIERVWLSMDNGTYPVEPLDWWRSSAGQAITDIMSQPCTVVG